MISTRRRFLAMSAAASLTGLSARARAAAPTAVWEGTALGARSRIVIAGLLQHDAREVFDRITDEIARLEDIFSLYRPNSQLCRLNQKGEINWPAPELLTVLSFSNSVWQASEGAFDPTIQPLWHARHSRTAETDMRHSLSDMEVSGRRVRFASPDMSLTLNGIAQGYITDRVAEVLTRAGLHNAAVNAGETLLRGTGPAGDGWRLGLLNTEQNITARLTSSNRAFATSSPQAMHFADGSSHIIDARTGAPARSNDTLTIAAPSAAFADALSTAACCLTTAEVRSMLSKFDDAELIARA